MTSTAPIAPSAGGDQDQVEAILTAFRQFASYRLNSRQIDERRTVPPSAVLELAEMGLFGLQIDDRHGGQALSYSATSRVMEQIAAADPNLALLVGVHNSVGVAPIRTFAHPDRQAEVLPRLARGAALATIAASEPGAGSNVRAIRTFARRRPGGGYVLHGEKCWISLGSWAAFVNVFAQLVDDRDRRLGITGFLVDARNEGFRPGEEALTFGMKGIPQNRIAIEGMMLPAESRLGEEAGGLEVAQCGFMAGRALIGALSLGAMERCLQIAVRYACRRDVAGGRLIENGRTRQILAECVCSAEAVRALVYHIADELDRSGTVEEELYFACKIMGSELMWQVVDRCVQLLGARGFLDTNVVGQYFRDMRLMRIFEGATEVVTGHVGAKVLLDPAALAEMLTQRFDQASTLEPLMATLLRLAALRRADDGIRHVVSHAAGELVCWAILAAVTSSDARCGGTELGGQTASWCRQQLIGRIRAAGSDLDRGVRLPPSESLAATVAEYGLSIGDLEERLPGEATELDVLLRCEMWAPPEY
jgi:alkylation response protein AidB-like acyl-CoA dehydrogenase